MFLYNLLGMEVSKSVDKKMLSVKEVKNVQKRKPTRSGAHQKHKIRCLISIIASRGTILNGLVKRHLCNGLCTGEAEMSRCSGSPEWNKGQRAFSDVLL